MLFVWDGVGGRNRGSGVMGFGSIRRYRLKQLVSDSEDLYLSIFHGRRRVQ